MRARAIALAVWLAASPLAASAATWTSTGPGAAHVTALGLDPALPGTLYAGTRGGAVFRSSDGGTTWQRTAPSGDWPIRDVAVSGSLVLVSSDSSFTSSSGGVYRSIDGGGAWSYAGAAAGITNALVGPVEIDPGNASILLAGTNAGLFRSVDSGSSWGEVAVPTGTQIYDLLFDPASPGTVYAGSNSGVSRSTDHGASFHLFNTGAAAGTYRLALDGTTLYAARLTGVSRTSIAAAGWTDASNGIPMDTTFGGLAATPNGILAAGGATVYRTATGFISWAPSASPGFSVSGLVTDPTAPSRVFAFGAGLGRSTNAGASWDRIGLDIVGLGTSAVAATSAGAVLVGTQNGLMRSADLGATFIPASDGLTTTSIDAIAVDPLDPRNALAAGGVQLFASSDGGVTWAPRPFPSSLLTPELEFAPSQPRIVYASTFTGAIGVVRRSADGGFDWPLVNPVPPINFPSDLAVDPSDPNVAYLAADDRVLRTLDGMTWEPAQAGLPPGTPRTLAIDPVDPATVYLGMGSAVWRSQDRASSWAPTGPLPPGPAPVDILVDPLRPGTVYVATDGGILRSTDVGATWAAFSDGLPNLRVGALAIDRDHAALYAATEGGLAVARFVAALRPTLALGAAVIAPGGQTTLAVTLRNDGPDDATRVTLALGVPAELGVLAADVGGVPCATTPAVGCAVPRLDAGQEVAATFVLQAGPVNALAMLSLTAAAAQETGAGATASAALRIADAAYVAATVIPVVKRKALVPIACPPAAPKKKCKGSVRLDGRTGELAGRRLGKARFSVSRGADGTAKVRLKKVTLDPGQTLDANATLASGGASATTAVVLQRK